MLIRLLIAASLLVIVGVIVARVRQHLRAGKDNSTETRSGPGAAPEGGKRPSRQQWLAIALVVLVLALTLSGRLNWIVTAGAGALALATRLAGLLPQLAMLARLWGRVGSRDATPLADTDWLQMLSRTSPIDARIRKGTFANRQLSQLTLSELMSLRGEVGVDIASLRILVLHVAGRGNAGSGAGAQAQHEGRPGREEAAAILGVSADSGRDEVVAAHRRLMQRLHPDRGGSDYLAAQINRAKDVLLGSD